MNRQTPPKNKKSKYILLSILAAFSVLIIVLACTVLFQLFFTQKANGAKQSRSLTDFSLLYQDSNSLRDMPEGLAVVDSTCQISSDQKSFTYALTLQSTATVGKELLLQVFLNEAFLSTYGNGVVNPIIKVTEDDDLQLYPDDKKSFQYTGVLYGEGEDAVNALKENLTNVYVEVFLSKFVGRFQLPVRFVETEK